MRHTLLRRARSTRRAGYSFLELTVSVTLFVVVLLSSLALMEQDTHLSRSTLGVTTVETLAQEMLFDIERELANAQGASSAVGNGMQAIVALELGASVSNELRVDSTIGFPDEGVLIVAPGSPTEERIAYTSLGADQESFLGLTRGEQCTESTTHPFQTTVLWAGLAEPVDSLGSGTSMELGGEVEFRGDGTGFSYRRPIDMDQGAGEVANYLVDEQIQWGSVTDAGPTLDGWSCIAFEAKQEYDESITGDDINGDGDTADLFDIGQLRRRSWNAADPTEGVAELGLGPTAVMQERCNWGGDLDGDGFEDPIFLWDPATRELRVRLFILGMSVDEVPIVRRVEAAQFLRNEQEL